jgi:hypothetical protein
VTFSYTYRWAQLDQDIVDPAKAEKRDRDLEQYLYAPPQQYEVAILTPSGGHAAWVPPTAGYWERQRGQFVVLRADWFATSDATDGMVLPVPSAAAPATVDVGGAVGSLAFPCNGSVVRTNGLGQIVAAYSPMFVFAGGVLAAQFIGFTMVAGDSASACICYRERT